MSLVGALQAAKTRVDLAALLAVEAKGLSYIVYKLPDALKYHEFEIPKKHGGTRKIAAPHERLKKLQKRLANYLHACLLELEAEKVKRSTVSHAFKKDHSIITNAKYHRARRYVFNVDLKDFFGTINFGRVRGFLIKDKYFSLDPAIATVIAQIACFKNALPQGSPCSPIISNLVGNALDVRLLRLAHAHDCAYTRYADDLTFSTNEREFPTSIAELVGPTWIAGKTLTDLITSSGFEINTSKTRMQYRDSRQDVTGLVVNKKVNVKSDYRKTVRCMVHRLFTTGEFEFVRRAVDVAGMVTKVRTLGKQKQLHGMLGFIDHIDLYNRDLQQKSHAAVYQKATNRITSKETMYRRFLLFHNFYAAPRPVLICEGKTDNVYLVHAIRSLHAAFPTLANLSPNGKIDLKVRIFKYTEKSTGRILNISGGGAGQLARFVHLYCEQAQKFKAPGAYQPVFVLCDSDEGGAQVFATVKKFNKTAVITDRYTHVFANLYVVPTPVPAGKTQSMIEDLFTVATKAKTLDGKTFNPSNDIDYATEYGKAAFAERVVKAEADKIDFTDFGPWLKTMSDVITMHLATHPALSKTP